MPSNHDYTIIVPEKSDGTRLDIFLIQYFGSDTTRSAIQRAIRNEQVSVDEKRVTKPSSTIHTGQTIRYDHAIFPPRPSPRIEPNPDIPLSILYTDENLLVVNKQPGIPVHSGDRNEHPTIADALIARYPELKGVGEHPLRPGIVHRLDQDTSGVLLVARTQDMFEHLKHQFLERRVVKIYTALVSGILKEEDGIIKREIARSKRNPLRRMIALHGEGKKAETHYRVVERVRHCTLLEVRPVTGRMHQIRVHLAHLGFPIVGDALYKKRRKEYSIPSLNRQFLHASSITIRTLEGIEKTFRSPLPKDLSSFLDILRVNH